MHSHTYTDKSVIITTKQAATCLHTIRTSIYRGITTTKTCCCCCCCKQNQNIYSLKVDALTTIRSSFFTDFVFFFCTFHLYVYGNDDDRRRASESCIYGSIRALPAKQVDYMFVCSYV